MALIDTRSMPIRQSGRISRVRSRIARRISFATLIASFLAFAISAPQLAHSFVIYMAQ